MKRRANVSIIVMVMLAVTVGACKKKTPPVVRPQPPAVTANTTTPPLPPPPPKPVSEPVPVPPEPLKDDGLTSKSLDDLNRDSPLKPLFYELDSSEVSPTGQQVLQANAAVLKRYPTWQITIEGHCDERGTAEYNLALGDRRAPRRRLPGLASAFRRQGAHRELRQGVPVRRRARRCRVVQEPPRHFVITSK